MRKATNPSAICSAGVTDGWRWVGERALLRTYSGEIEAANRSALGAYRVLSAAALPEVIDLVPGARSLLVLLAPDHEPSAALRQAMDAPAAGFDPGAPATHEIVASYGGADGPDLPDVARASGLSEAEVVRLHSGARYTVAFIGFSPGFPYLLGLPGVLATPRLATPRTRVPAGSVGIGGPYAGIYPHATAGGWRLIGRTDRTLFDPASNPPSVFAPGDAVRFVPA